MNLITRTKVRLGLLWGLFGLLLLNTSLYQLLLHVLFSGYGNRDLTHPEYLMHRKVDTIWDWEVLLLLVGLLAAGLYNFRRLNRDFPRKNGTYDWAQLLTFLLVIVLSLLLCIALCMPRGGMLG
ncbi:hypothetical protein LGH70_12650 [Hymenobacter sp. BT635]|uniref:Uncharacterized protein n=1 Tax=Hymenobacter nitidus TaxID=2880929 RepID=A0ABS8AEY1_9BACT|nr:hypothetical protein [Hymenobacter nitidus]MCB2378441.1 hypothetical protein [Hymenobacter nitidus]